MKSYRFLNWHIKKRRIWSIFFKKTSERIFFNSSEFLSLSVIYFSLSIQSFIIIRFFSFSLVNSRPIHFIYFIRCRFDFTDSDSNAALTLSSMFKVCFASLFSYCVLTALSTVDVISILWVEVYYSRKCMIHIVDAKHCILRVNTHCATEGRCCWRALFINIGFTSMMLINMPTMCYNRANRSLAGWHFT
jgi:hypothetical protein